MSLQNISDVIESIRLWSTPDEGVGPHQLASMCTRWVGALEAYVEESAVTRRVPDGWQLVPKEPTPEIRAAMLEKHVGRHSELAHWYAVLSVAPKFAEAGAPREASEHYYVPAMGEAGEAYLAQHSHQSFHGKHGNPLSLALKGSFQWKGLFDAMRAAAPKPAVNEQTGLSAPEKLREKLEFIAEMSVIDTGSPTFWKTVAHMQATEATECLEILEANGAAHKPQSVSDNGDSELRPCPFCGEAGVMDWKRAGQSIYDELVYRVHCDCGATRGTWQDSEHDALIDWNQRAQPANKTPDSYSGQE